MSHQTSEAVDSGTDRRPTLTPEQAAFSRALGTILARQWLEQGQTDPGMSKRLPKHSTSPLDRSSERKS
jgi:hypothetical protein